MKHEQQIKILVFAKEHDYIVTPMGWAKHLQAISQHGHCPCDSDRLECPCTLAEKEIAETGHCKCSLLWRSYDTYLAQCYLDEWPLSRQDLLKLPPAERRPILESQAKDLVKSYELHRYCRKCGNDEVFQPITIVNGVGYYSSNADFCTKCGKSW